MLDVAEQNVDLLVTHVVVPETILVDLDGAAHTLTLHSRPHEDVVEPVRSPVADFDQFVLLNHILHILLLLLLAHCSFLHVRHLILDVLHATSILASESK
ncbi:hypothetical protein KC366_g83 [Hortaea werneckii]|nr:hypothetical protein KC366_g83 [Hortaea werneckii]